MKVFDSVMASRLKRNVFDLSHPVNLSCSQGDLIPVWCEEIVPGDDFRKTTECMVRLAPTLAPHFSRINVKFENFFVPLRLIWSEYEKAFTGGKLGTTAPVWPYLTVNAANAETFEESTLADYLGFPAYAVGTVPTQEINVSALPFRAYQLIYDEYYRNQNLIDPIGCSTSSGVQAGAEVAKLGTIRKRMWEKDPFTSCLPNTQRGADVILPVDVAVDYLDQSLVKPTAGGNYADGAALITLGGGIGELNIDPAGGAGPSDARIENIESISGTSVSINEFRRARALQVFLEKLMRGGARYTEYVLMIFGVKSDDARLQRPEFLGGYSQPVVVSEVLGTNQLDEETVPLGNMAGHGIAVGADHGFNRKGGSYFAKEHGFMVTIMSILPRTVYQQGIPKMWTRADRLDVFQPDFANIGEQATLVGEVFYDPIGAAGEVLETFGYSPRYSEYKYKPGRVCGVFRSSLSYWGQTRIFGAKPVLNESFVTAVPSTGIFAVQTAGTEHFYVNIFHKIKARRPMPYYGTPSKY